MAAVIAHIATEHARRLADDGFFVLDGVLPAGDPELLRRVPLAVAGR
jgi:hypothetical protein